MTELPEGWGEYRKLILTQLVQLQKDTADLRKMITQFREEDLTEVKVDLALLKLKNSMWAALIGGCAAVLTTGGALFLRMIH